MSKTRTLSDLVQTEGTITLLSGTTAERPANPAPGQQRFNTDTGFTEVYDGNNWVINEGTTFLAEGGTETTITDGGVNYKVHTFTSSGTFNVLSGTKDVEYLVVAGGGAGGGAGTGGNGGGGGAGGYRSSVVGENSGGGAPAETTNILTTTGSYNIIVGAGGASSGFSGDPQVGYDSSFGSITSLGGGGGADYNTFADNGGSGGGGSSGENGNGSAGSVNTGGGGGGAENATGGNGGSGVVIIRYQI